MSRYVFGDPNYLAHYGVLGMKWGVRRYQDKNGRLTPEGKKRYLNKSNSSPEKEIENGSVMLAVAAVAAFYGLPLTIAATASAIGRATANAKEQKQDKHAQTLKKDPKTGLPIKDREYTAEEDCKKVNPARGSGDHDLTMNCTMCSLAFDLRRRGYDVRACRSDFGLTDADMEKFYKDGKMTNWKIGDKDVAQYYSPDEIRIRRNQDRKYLNKMPKEISESNSRALDDIAKQGNGARGMLVVRWVGQWSAHAVSYQVENGKTIIYDCQSGRKVDISEFNRMSGAIKSYMRTDDKTPDYEFIKEKAYVI